ncbi:hypothetical protein F5Y17DRAFT_467115 [Xylariaceae sp. FL0594]|nr:hypothetical protein F5Y17DRAFT_467115 [Xylariaceae sp. FL0594]
MSSYEARRLENIKRNVGLIKDLGQQRELGAQPQVEVESSSGHASASQERRVKRPRLDPPRPTRTSARIANATKSTETQASQQTTQSSARRPRKRDSPAEGPDVETLRASWSSWTPTASPPTRDEQGNYHFESHPSFTPNKSPEDVIREGSFGGSYWRPLYSRRLRTTIADDWRELPESWTAGLSIERHLTSPTYDPEVNKYGVACGQSIEEWEAAGWINHQYDVRGWFQWYCRFWMGRRCDDDERQISRWRRCVGETGRWRRTLLKQYVKNGIRTVADEDDQTVEKNDVSPVVHQTCHHWAWEVRQEALDQFWNES